MQVHQAPLCACDDEQSYGIGKPHSRALGFGPTALKHGGRPTSWPHGRTRTAPILSPRISGIIARTGVAGLVLTADEAALPARTDTALPSVKL